MSKILFSPVGMTDPITHLFDGSMLHICRVYKPDVLILYMSAEVIEFHEKDNRYLYCIEQLSKHMNHTIDVHIIKRPDLKDVQIYDLFYDDFQNIVAEILKKKSVEDEVLLNIASGTPAMKSALLVLSVLADNKFRPIQVATPTRKSNQRLEDKVSYDVEANWELNEDNADDFENRCSEPATRNFSVLLTKDSIRKLVAVYDYEAALIMAAEIKDHISESGMNLIKIGCNRLKLNQREVDILVNKVPYDIIPIKASNQRTVFEYALSLDIKRKKGEYADFVRALTPLVADLVEVLLKKQCKIDIRDYCRVDHRGVRRFDEDKLKGSQVWNILQQEFNGKVKLDLVGTRQIVPLIMYMSDDIVLKQKVNDIMEVEQKIRNLSAHEIVSVTPEWIRQKSNFTVEQIFDLIKYLIIAAGVNATQEDWNSYDVMNKYIHNEL